MQQVDHGLEGQFVKREDHLLWIDIPTEKPYLEEQVKGGTSRYNEGELQTIRRILLDLNEAVKAAKKQGVCHTMLRKAWVSLVSTVSR